MDGSESKDNVKSGQTHCGSEYFKILESRTLIETLSDKTSLVALEKAISMILFDNNLLGSDYRTILRPGDEVQVPLLFWAASLLPLSSILSTGRITIGPGKCHGTCGEGHGCVFIILFIRMRIDLGRTQLPPFLRRFAMPIGQLSTNANRTSWGLDDTRNWNWSWSWIFRRRRRRRGLRCKSMLISQLPPRNMDMRLLRIQPISQEWRNIQR